MACTLKREGGGIFTNVSKDLLTLPQRIESAARVQLLIIQISARIVFKYNVEIVILLQYSLSYPLHPSNTYLENVIKMAQYYKV
jgi:hypothetical protein